VIHYRTLGGGVCAIQDFRGEGKELGREGEEIGHAKGTKKNSNQRVCLAVESAIGSCLWEGEKVFHQAREIRRDIAE